MSQVQRKDLLQSQPWHRTAVPQWDQTLQEREGQRESEQKGGQSEREGQGVRGRKREKGSRNKETRSIRLPDKLNQGINPLAIITPKMYTLYM